MVARISVFVVGNGDMTLIELESGRKILIDINVRGAADDPDDDTPDVARELRDRLTRDAQGRLYVDAFLLSHPDQDHCRGLQIISTSVRRRNGRKTTTGYSCASSGLRR